MSTDKKVPDMIKESIFVLLYILNVTYSLPYPHQNKQYDGLKLKPTTVQKNIDFLPTDQPSMYVRFSERPPEYPPWITEPNIFNTGNNTRTKRSSTSHIAEPVCDSISTWVEKESAEDMWGNNLQVVRNIQIGGARMVQYFYETYCGGESRNNHPCRGIDSAQYTSKCETKHIWAYAQVRTSSNEIGWTHIKIRGSCNCALYSKQTRHNFWEDLLKKR